MNPTRIYPFLAGIALAIWPLTVTAQDAEPADEGVVLQFPNNPVSDIIEVYEKLTGRSVIKHSEIFEGNTISLVTPTPVSRQDAIRLIESALQLNEFAVSKDEQTNTIRIMPEDTNQVNVHVGLPVYGSPEELPDNDVVIEYFMRLQHIDPVEAGEMFTNHLGLNPYGRITPVLSPAGLLITENSSIVRQLIQLQEVMDHPHDRAARITEFVKIEHAEASVLAQIIQATLINRPEPPSAGEATISSGGRRGNRSSGGPNSDEETPPQVTADDRLNRVMIVASPEDHQYILRLISEWDRPITGANQIERPLKYLYVDEVLPVLVDVLQDTGVGTTALPGGGTITTRQPPQASTAASTLTGRIRSGVEVRETGTGTVSGEQDMLISPLENTAPISVSVGKTRIIADLQANSIIAMGPRESLDSITDLLDKLDRKPPQVYLATVIGQLTLGDEINYGVDYLQRFKSLDSNPVTQGGTASFLSRTSLADSIADARTNLLTHGVDALAPGLNVYGQIGESLDVFINALESTSKFKVLSRPSIYAANNKKAVITSGQRIPVPTSSLTDIDRSTAVRTNIEFQDVVLKLEVVPLINSDKEVTLTIAQVNDTVVGQQRVADNTVPIIGTEKLTTTVTIPNRQTVVLGGLITESEDKTDDGIPIVSRIPVIGHAFKNSKSSTTRKELIVFIQPTVVQAGHDLGMASHAEDLRTKVGEEAAETFPENDTVLRRAGVEFIEEPQPSMERPQPSAKAISTQEEELERWTWRNLLPKSPDSNAASINRK